MQLFRKYDDAGPMTFLPILCNRYIFTSLIKLCYQDPRRPALETVICDCLVINLGTLGVRSDAFGHQRR